ncbi:MAG: hypothetical protein ABI843_06585 [Dokdonella sp.]
MRTMPLNIRLVQTMADFPAKIIVFVQAAIRADTVTLTHTVIPAHIDTPTHTIIPTHPVIPAKAGIHFCASLPKSRPWIPAFAGMTAGEKVRQTIPAFFGAIPAFAGMTSHGEAHA